MFADIGSKIKSLARVLCWLGIIAAVISGIALISQGSASRGYYSSSSGSLVFSGFLVMVLGSLFSWVGSFVLYGFGELVEASMETRDYFVTNRGARYLQPDTRPVAPPSGFAPSSPVPAPAEDGEEDIAGELQALKERFEAGELAEEAYKDERAKLLDRL